MDVILLSINKMSIMEPTRVELFQSKSTIRIHFEKVNFLMNKIEEHKDVLIYKGNSPSGFEFLTVISKLSNRVIFTHQLH